MDGANELKLNPKMTEVLLMRSSLILGNRFTPRLAGVAFPTKPSFHSLGVLLDPGLHFHKQVSTVAKSV